MTDHNERPGFVGALEKAVRDNPVSAALVGVGVLWMFVGGSRLSAAAALIPASGRAAADLAGKVGDTGTDLARSAKSVASDSAGKIARLANAVGEVASSSAHAASTSTAAVEKQSSPSFAAGPREQLGEIFGRQPLLLGAVGLAVGAGIGASLPGTAAENELLGSTADAVKSHISDFADDQKGTLSRALDAGMAEAESQGLTKDAAFDAISELGGALSSVAKAATPQGAS